MAAHIDILNSSNITLNRDGYRAQRVAMVSGVSGTAAEVLYNAINDAALPDIGDAHPDVSTITLQEVTCTPLGGGQYKVVMSYYKDAGSTTGTSTAQPRCTVAVAVEETSLDIDGVSMQTAYRKSGAVISQRFTAEVERPRITFEFEYIATTWPTSALTTYAGKINSVAWNGYATGTILCTGINVSPEGDNYSVVYSFAYRPEGWQYQAKTANPPPLLASITEPDALLDLDTGIRPYSVYASVDFSALGFTFDSVGYTAQFLTGKFRITGSDATLTHTVP